MQRRPASAEQPVDETPLSDEASTSSSVKFHSISDVAIESIEFGDGPRLAGENTDYIKLLADIETELPPVIVNRNTMQIIDGRHRVRAAQMRGDKTISAELIEANDDDSFILGVEYNIAHGLPLSSCDRKAAATRILYSHPHWSDRAIARASGLSARTVASLRRRSTADLQQLNDRVGQDGRVRPVDINARRAQAAKILADNPTAPLREVAKAAGVSLGTAHDVSKNVRRAQDDVRKSSTQGTDNADPDRTLRGRVKRLRHQGRCLESSLQILSHDPSIRYSQSGRQILTWLRTHSIQRDEWNSILDGIPPHLVEIVVGMARDSAAEWCEFAKRLESAHQAE